MEVEQLVIPKKKAEQEFKTLKEAFKKNDIRRVEQIYRDMQKVYGHMQHGRKIIDIWEAFKKTGLNKEGDPKLAIIRADAKICYCQKSEGGTATFSMEDLDRWQRHPKTIGNIKLPLKTFTWILESPTAQPWQIKRRYLKTVVPIIPPEVLVKEVKVLLRNYHILWEVEKWQPIPPIDPILLKQLTPNLFGVLATWNLTELERAIIRGRIS